MNCKNIYEVDGEEYTLAELSRKFNIRRDILARRLNGGWSVEKAVTTPMKNMPEGFDRGMIGKKIPVIFQTSPPVLPEMQPVLGKEYLATICGTTKKAAHSHIYYMITLENGKKLITYPNECELLLASLQKAD